MRLSVTLSSEEVEMLRRLAREMGVSMAGWVRVVVREKARGGGEQGPTAPEPDRG